MSNRNILLPLLLTAVLLTGCAKGGSNGGFTAEGSFNSFTEESVFDITEDSTVVLPLELPELVPIHHDNPQTSDEPELKHVYTEYYAYNGRRYWVSIESGTGCFVEENGSYALVPDEFGELMPEEQLFGIDKIMYCFNAEDYLYLGRSETEINHPEFYVHKDGEYILRICADDDVLMYYSIPQEMLGEGRTPVEISVLVASKI